MTLEEYRQFVDSVTSKESKDFASFSHRLSEVHSISKSDMLGDVNVPRLITAAFGLVSEGGEFTEVVKKVLFQGKELDEDNRTRLVKELGDVAWYWANACTALNVDPLDVLELNAEKLKARFGGAFFG